MRGLSDADDYWHTLLTFDLTLRGRTAETMTHSGFIAYRNHTRWPVPAPLPSLDKPSEERARLIGELTWRNPAMADLFADLEVDDALRARVEIDLLR